MRTDKTNPVVVGVTGHRNIVVEDKPAIRAQVEECLKEILSLCKGTDTPVIMLNAFAQGADMLCAEVAFGLGIDVYAVLPYALERYIKSFDDLQAKGRLRGCLDKCKRVFLSPDTEKCREKYKAEADMDDDSYDYRQLGIYTAVNSHILLALWDGKPPKVRYGCGTVEVIDFALESKAAVAWIKCRRQGDGDNADIKRKWITGSRADGVREDTPQGYLKELIAKANGKTEGNL